MPDGPVIGVRCWSSQLVGGIYLRGIGPCRARPFAVWRPGANKAVCGTPAAHETYAGMNELPPAPLCGCGLYAYHDYADDIGRFPSEPTGKKSPVGIVRGWGRMHIHPDGWRAEYAEILALIENGDARLRDVAARYGVPLLSERSMPNIAVEFGNPVPLRIRPRNRMQDQARWDAGDPRPKSPDDGDQ